MYSHWSVSTYLLWLELSQQIYEIYVYISLHHDYIFIVIYLIHTYTLICTSGLSFVLICV